jgi:lipoate-protein ligase A
LPLAVADQQQHIDQSELLLARAVPGQPATLYWSQADPTGIVLGFSQKPIVLNAHTLATHPIPVYRRRAGGTAVLVGPHLLSLDVVLPAQHPLILPDIVESYRWFGEAWVKTLQLLSVQTRAVSIDEAHTQRILLQQPETREREAILRRACYGSLSPYEVVAGQRKVVGLDMIRRKAGSLLQAGLLLHWETQLLAQLLGHTAEELHERAIGLNTLTGRVITVQEVIAAFEQVLLTVA